MTISYLKSKQKRQILRAVFALRGCIVIFILLVTVLLTNFCQMLTLALWPISRRLFRRANRNLAGAWWALLIYLMEKVQKIEIKIYGGLDFIQDENALLIANHQEMADIPALLYFAARKKRLRDLKWFVKDVLKYVPGIGWGLMFLDCVFLKRNWLQDKEHIFKTFEVYREQDFPFWLVAFPEGTRITSGKVEKNREFSKLRKLPVFANVLLPKSKGFSASVQALRSRCGAIYDLTLGFEGGIPTLFEMSMGSCKRIHIYCERIPISELPYNDKELRSWLLAQFSKKERLMAYFRLNNSFPSE